VTRQKKRNVKFRDIIDDVRRQLSDDGARIAGAPLPFRHAWWPDAGLDNLGKLYSELLSNYGVPSGPKEITAEFYTEVEAIQDSLLRLENVADVAAPGETELATATRQVLAGANRRAKALSVWEKIAFPIRQRGSVVFRIVAPQDIFGTPIVDAMPVDEFIRRVSLQTIRDKQQLARLQTHLRRWWNAAGIVAFIAAMFILHELSQVVG
jgi:hypothetical protein